MIRGMMRSMLLLPAIVAIQAAHGAETDTGADLRDPFWPVSFNAPAPGPTSTNSGVLSTRAKPIQQWPELPIKGISRSLDGSFFVLIEGVGVVRKGEVASVFSDTQWFHWRITEINAKGVRTIKLGISRDRNDIPPSNQEQPVMEKQR